MHAIGSEIMGDSEYLHGISVLNTTSQCIYNASRSKLDSQYIFVLQYYKYQKCLNQKFILSGSVNNNYQKS